MTEGDEQNLPAALADTPSAAADEAVDSGAGATNVNDDSAAQAGPDAVDEATDVGAADVDEAGADELKADASESDTSDADTSDVETGEADTSEEVAPDGDEAEVDQPDAGNAAATTQRRRAAASGRAPRRAAPALNLNFSRPSVDVRAWLATAREGIRTLMARPLTSFHLIVGLAVILTICGLIMVQSASSVEDYANKQSAYGAFTTQAVFAVAGWVAFYFMIRLPVRFFRRIATAFMVACLVLLALVLVPHIGVEVDGARRWFDVAGISIQPSELAKVALCIWGAHVLASRRSVNKWGWELLVPLVPVVAIMCGLIIAEPNLSTTVIMLVIAAALLWFSGLSAKIFAAFVAGTAFLGVAAALSADYRAARVFSFLGTTDDPLDGGYQALQAKYALVNGGVFGVGLGQSTAKWSYLPNAHNDFIFAILVEETGLIGGLVVVGLFLLLGFVGMRIALRSADPFLRLLTGTITVLITTQMFINVGYVVGLLPVTGIQLPLLSQGGTSMLTMLTMLGLMASAARHEPAAVVALSSRRSRGLSGLLRLPAPAAYRPRAGEPLDRLARRGKTGPAADTRRSDTRSSDPRRSDARRPEPRRVDPRRGDQRRQEPRAGRADAGSGRRAPAPGARRPAPARVPRQAAPRARQPWDSQAPRTTQPGVDPRTRTRAQASDEIHYPARQASNRIPTDPRRSAGRSRAVSSPRRTEYRQR